MHVLNGLGPQDPASRFDHSQDSASSYDHPYFGQLFLAAVFKLIGYPNSVLNPSNPSGSSSSSPSSSSISSSPTNNIRTSIEMLYLVPRVLMGILSIIDTFLVYKIAERRYNRNVALIASVLFAVMPMTWLLRRILLDSILMPFLLSSILFAVYYHSSNTDTKYSKTTSNKNKRITTILLSGIFLGLAIFTKVPAFTMIPLVGFLLVYTGNNNSNSKNKNKNKDIDNKSNIKHEKLKTLGLWLIPVILIPSIWPIYSMSIGQFNMWLGGLSYQTGRENENHSLLESVDLALGIDPVLLIVGIAGIGFSAVVKRDFLFLLWVVPFIAFFAAIALVQYFYWILVIPAFCIAAARLIEYVSNKISSSIGSNSRGRKNNSITNNNNNNNNITIINNNTYSKNNNNDDDNIRRKLLLPFIIASAIGIFGLVSTTLLITTDVNSSYFNIYSFIVQHLPDRKDNGGSGTGTMNNSTMDANKVTMIGRHYVRAFIWIPKYIFHKDFDFIDPHFNDTVKTQNVLFILDNPMITSIERHNELKDVDKGYLLQYLQQNYMTIAYHNRIKVFYDITNKLDTFIVNLVPNNADKYIYTSMTVTPGIGSIEVRADY